MVVKVTFKTNYLFSGIKIYSADIKFYENHICELRSEELNEG